MFELLDEGHTGMISAQNLRNFLEKAYILKQVGFDAVKYEQERERNEGIKEKFNMYENDLEDLVAEFDLTGDRLISPEEFYNIIMAFYD